MPLAYEIMSRSFIPTLTTLKFEILSIVNMKDNKQDEEFK